MRGAGVTRAAAADDLAARELVAALHTLLHAPHLRAGPSRDDPAPGRITYVDDLPGEVRARAVAIHAAVLSDSVMTDPHVVPDPAAARIALAHHAHTRRTRIFRTGGGTRVA